MSSSKVSTLASQTSIDHVTVTTSLAYDRLVKAFEGELGRLDSELVISLVKARAPWSEVKAAIERVGGPHGLMIIAAADQGAVTSLSGKAKRCVLYIVGNPVIASDIID